MIHAVPKYYSDMQFFKSLGSVFNVIKEQIWFRFFLKALVQIRIHLLSKFELKSKIGPTFSNNLYIIIYYC